MLIEAKYQGNKITAKHVQRVDGTIAYARDLAKDPSNGFTTPTGQYIHGRKSKIEDFDQRVRAFKFALANLQLKQMPPNCEVWHEGRCGRCARKLTDPTSIASGFGPECITKMECT